MVDASSLLLDRMLAVDIVAIGFYVAVAISRSDSPLLLRKTAFLVKCIVSER